VKDITVECKYYLVFDNVLEVLTKNDFYIKESSKAQKYITANKKGSFFSYGETIEITFEKFQTSTKVSVNSFSMGIQLIDWGGNNENEELIIKEMKKHFK